MNANASGAVVSSLIRSVDKNKIKNKEGGYGHRSRLRERFLNGGGSAVQDYELLEMILFSAFPRGDVKPLSKALLKHFKTFSNVLNADQKELLNVEGMGKSSVSALKVVLMACHKLLKEEIQNRPVMMAWHEVLNYCRVSMAHLKKEELHLLFLDSHYKLIQDEIHQTGTIDHIAVYTREIVQRALNLGAASLIMVHNHPTHNPSPSEADITTTRHLKAALEKLGIDLYDHIIIGGGAYISLKSEKLI